MKVRTARQDQAIARRQPNESILTRAGHAGAVDLQGMQPCSRGLLDPRPGLIEAGMRPGGDAPSRDRLANGVKKLQPHMRHQPCTLARPAVEGLL